MKTTLLTLIFVIGILLNSIGQVTLEATYDTAAGNLYMINLEVSGQKYVKVKRTQNDRFIYLYNLNHSLWKTINCNTFPFGHTPSGDTIYNFDVLYITEKLFDLDNDVEFIFSYNTGIDCYAGIYNEDGTVIFSQDSAWLGVRLNIPIVFQPIYNTPNGTKMILSFPDNNKAKVYSLQGTLSTPELINNSVISESLKIFPNPTNGATTIEYKLPNSVNFGNIEIYDLNGRLIKNYMVENTFQNIRINNGELSAGTYIYCLKAGSKIIDSRQIIITK